tara:strand:- start:2290 stop:3537 length:1248 start_codon:yes stop_codon:yes gene_type:complete
MSNFESLGLTSEILSAIKDKGYYTPTPIQLKAIPIILQGKDMLGVAQTGTGKTAAFSLPILNLLQTRKKKVVKGKSRVLILTPTRELATQIEQNVIDYSCYFKVKTKVIFGGVGHRPQIQAIAKGLDIIVATPGRLLDLINDGVVTFDFLELLVLDEADRMLDMGFIRDIKKIMAILPKKRQTLLFSATMPREISKLAEGILKDPVRVEVTPESTTVDKIKQSIHTVPKAHKPLLLKTILRDKSIKSALVFTRTKHGANRVVKHLENSNIPSAAIHGNKSQRARENSLNSFRQEKIRVLVATDIAARGIDIDHVGYVINYDLPSDPENYVHRIGRTGRAGREGTALSFCDDTELSNLRSIEKLIKIKIPKEEKVELDLNQISTKSNQRLQNPNLKKKSPQRKKWQKRERTTKVKG